MMPASSSDKYFVCFNCGTYVRYVEISPAETTTLNCPSCGCGMRRVPDEAAEDVKGYILDAREALKDAQGLLLGTKNWGELIRYRDEHCPTCKYHLAEKLNHLCLYAGKKDCDNAIDDGECRYEEVKAKPEPMQ